MFRLQTAFAVLALAATMSSHAAANTALCKLFAKQQWSEQGTQTLDDCLRLIDSQSVDRNAENALRFGSWGDTLLAADLSVYYRSENGGADWIAIGAKNHSIDPATMSSRAPPPAPTPRPRPAPVAYVAPTQPVPLVMPTAADVAAASARDAGEVDAYTSLGVAKEQRNRCELMVQQLWRVQPESSLEDCARTMEYRGSYDRNGQLRAYWGSVYLTADPKSIYVSKNGSNWVRLRERK